MATILERLVQSTPDLSPKMAVAALYAAENPDVIAFRSMRSVASKCGVASPTMLRLARMMGYQSYEGFRADFQDLVAGDGFRARADRLRGGKPAPNERSLTGEICDAAIGNVKQTFASNDPVVLRKMAAAMREAETNYLLGFGSMNAVMAIMRLTGGMALPNLRPQGPGDATAIEALAGLTPNDVVLALGLSPYAKSTVTALAFAHQRGASILAITDTTDSPLLDHADHHILAATSSPHYYPSLVPVIAVVEALLATIIAEGGSDLLDRIAQVEELRAQSGAYVG